MGCPVRWFSSALPPGLMVAMGYQQEKALQLSLGGKPIGVVKREGTSPRSLSSLLVPCSASAALQCGAVHPGPWLSPSAGSGEVLPIPAPSSAGWRIWSWGETLPLMAQYGAGGLGNGQRCYGTLIFSIRGVGHLLAPCDK